jgi:hypothetical protein
MRVLVSNAESGVSKRAKFRNFSPIDSIKEVVDVAASVLQLDPWAHIVDKLALRGNRPIPASLWYYEPSAADGKFEVKTWSAPGAPEKVIAVFAGIASGYKALAHDEEWFNHACESCSNNGEVDEDSFLREHGRSMKTSLVGWTFKKASALTSLNPRSKLVFNRDHEEVVPDARNDVDVASWLVVDDFASCPVFDPASLEVRPRGVLILLKNSRQGITPEDRSALATTAAMIGFVLSNGVKQE